MLDKKIDLNNWIDGESYLKIRKINAKTVYFVDENETRFKMKIPRTNNWSKPIKGNWDDVKVHDIVRVTPELFVSTKDSKFLYINYNVTQKLKYPKYILPMNIRDIDINNKVVQVMSENGTDIILKSRNKGHLVCIRKPNNETWKNVKVGDNLFCTMVKMGIGFDSYWKLYAEIIE